MESFVFLFLIWCALSLFGAWVAVQKDRNPVEGLIVGFLFGPLGVMVEAMLPQGTHKSNIDQGTQQSKASQGTPKLNIDDEGVIAYIADQYRTFLDDIEPNWPRVSPARRRDVLRPIDKQLQTELKMSPTRYSGYAAIARRTIFEATTSQG